MNTLKSIYELFKDRQGLTLTRTTAFDGFTIDAPVLYGEREDDRFWLYKESDTSDDFVFSVEFQMPVSGDDTTVCHYHTHLYDEKRISLRVESFFERPYYYTYAHYYCMNNRPLLQKSSICGCFYCLEIFSPDKITRWLKDSQGTALCPHCTCDSVLPDGENYPITKEFLKDMKKVWFETIYTLKGKLIL